MDHDTLPHSGRKSDQYPESLPINLQLASTTAHMARKLDHRPAPISTQHQPSETRQIHPPHHPNSASAQSPPFPKPVPHRFSLEMIRQTISQMNTCLRPGVTELALPMLRRNVEPPASRLDNLVDQYINQQAITGRSTGLSTLEKQIKAADQEVAISLITEVQHTLTRAKREEQKNQSAEVAGCLHDVQILQDLYLSLCHQWKIGKYGIAGPTAAVERPSGIPKTKALYIPETRPGVKRKRLDEDEVDAEHGHRAERLKPTATAATPHSLTNGTPNPKPIVIELSDTTDDDGPVIQATDPAQDTTRKRSSKFQHVDLTWAVDKTNPGWRSKSDPGPTIHPAVTTGKHDPPRGTFGMFSYRPQPQPHGHVTQYPQTTAHEMQMHQLDEKARRLQEAALALPRSLPHWQIHPNHQMPTGHLGPATNHPFTLGHNRGFVLQLPHHAQIPSNLALPQHPLAHPHSRVTNPPNSHLPQHPLVHTHSHVTKPQDQFCARPNTRVLPPSAPKPTAPPPNLARDILRAIGKHPTLPPLNHNLADLLSKKQLQRYNPLVRDSDSPIGEVQGNAVQEAQRWWRRRRVGSAGV